MDWDLTSSFPLDFHLWFPLPFHLQRFRRDREHAIPLLSDFSYIDLSCLQNAQCHRLSFDLWIGIFTSSVTNTTGPLKLLNCQHTTRRSTCASSWTQPRRSASLLTLSTLRDLIGGPFIVIRNRSRSVHDSISYLSHARTPNRRALRGSRRFRSLTFQLLLVSLTRIPAPTIDNLKPVPLAAIFRTVHFASLGWSSCLRYLKYN